MFVKMTYEMFAERLPELTEGQKIAIWEYYKKVENQSKTTKLIFDAETIMADWTFYKSFSELYEKYKSTYTVEQWAKEHEEELLSGKQISYKDGFMAKISGQYRELMDGSYISVKA